MTDTATSPGLSRSQLRTLALSALGGALEFYDFVIFVYFAITIGALFFPLLASSHSTPSHTSSQRGRLVPASVPTKRTCEYE